MLLYRTGEHGSQRLRLAVSRRRHGQSLTCAVLEMAGAPGFEPGNGGIKILCLTAWLRPTTTQSQTPEAVCAAQQVTHVAARLKSFHSWRQPDSQGAEWYG